MTKQGKHGTLYFYRVTYHDASDLGSLPDVTSVWAYSADHAWERARESLDFQGFSECAIMAIERRAAA